MNHRLCPLVALGLVAAATVLAAQEQLTIDFRNYIPGVLDAPVFDADGVTKLAPTWTAPPGYDALLAVGKDSAEGSFVSVGASHFQSGTNAGYWEPKLVTVPGFAPGERIWVQVRAVEYLSLIWTEQPPYGLWGRSKVLSFAATNSPIQLIGLESFRLAPTELRTAREGNQLIIRWSLEAASAFELQVADRPNVPDAWQTVFAGDGSALSASFTNTMAGQQRFFRLLWWR
jgi:hypothetical protein